MPIPSGKFFVLPVFSIRQDFHTSVIGFIKRSFPMILCRTTLSLSMNIRRRPERSAVWRIAPPLRVSNDEIDHAIINLNQAIRESLKILASQILCDLTPAEKNLQCGGVEVDHFESAVSESFFNCSMRSEFVAPWCEWPHAASTCQGGLELGGQETEYWPKTALILTDCKTVRAEKIYQ